MNRKEFDQLRGITEQVVRDIKTDEADPYELLTPEAAMKKAGKMAILEAQRLGLMTGSNPVFEYVAASEHNTATQPQSLVEQLAAADIAAAVVGGGEATYQPGAYMAQEPAVDATRVGLQLADQRSK